MQNSMMAFTFFGSERKHPFWTNVVQTIWIASSRWNLVSRLIGISRIQCWYSIKHLFIVVNKELINITDWFTADKLSLNFEKKKKNTQSFISQVRINNYEIQREASIKFFGFLLEQYLTRKENIKLTENKIAKSISILYKVRAYLDKRALTCLYCSYIHYLNHANRACCITNRTSLTNRIIFHEKGFSHTREDFKEDNILSAY